MKDFFLESIEDLKPEILTNLLRNNWEIPVDFRGVERLSVERVEEGVLSQVYRVFVQYDVKGAEETKSELPKQWIVKLPRKDMPLEWMFLSEKVFYESVAPIINQSSLPFTVPRTLCAAEKYLILEGIEDSTCYSLISGTPAEKIDYVTFALASLHARTWKSTIVESKARELSNTPGMGQRLHPLQKEYLFTKQWREAVDAVDNLEPSVHRSTIHLCELMEVRRLRDIHHMVHSERYACIHGDFHIANFLFPNDDSKTPVLVDWATFGFGNPMTDLAFFMVLNESVASNAEGWLRKYHQNLTQCSPTLVGSFPLEVMLEKFRWAILCQWTILVAYDKMSRQLAAADRDSPQSEIKLRHFANVNRRAVLAMNSLGNFETFLDTIPLATEQESAEAQKYCIETPLSI